MVRDANAPDLNAATNAVDAKELVIRNRAEARYPVDEARCELVT